MQSGDGALLRRQATEQSQDKLLLHYHQQTMAMNGGLPEMQDRQDFYLLNASKLQSTRILIVNLPVMV